MTEDEQRLAIEEAAKIIAGYDEFLGFSVDEARAILAPMFAKIAALEAENAELRAALDPFAQQANAVEQFVADRAKDDGSPVMPMRAFRLAHFQRASAALGKDKP